MSADVVGAYEVQEDRRDVPSKRSRMLRREREEGEDDAGYGGKKREEKHDAMKDHESRKIEATRWQPELAWFTLLHRG